jgi:hypothetical protein
VPHTGTISTGVRRRSMSSGVAASCSATTGAHASARRAPGGRRRATCHTHSEARTLMA